MNPTLADTSSARNRSTEFTQMAALEIGPGSKPNRRALLARLDWVVLGVAAVGLLAALFWFVGGPVREVGRTSQCRNNLRQIGVALHAYNAE